jgi:hypothetical protein
LREVGLPGFDLVFWSYIQRNKEWSHSIQKALHNLLQFTDQAACISINFLRWISQLLISSQSKVEKFMHCLGFEVEELNIVIFSEKGNS